ncbi:MAG: hypothetical protein ABW139_18655 [Candidatus Thiodiazotropha sp. DIVDIV]
MSLCAACEFPLLLWLGHGAAGRTLQGLNQLYGAACRTEVNIKATVVG